MRVSSPIGELPFEPVRLRYEDQTLVIEGAMGAWPARVVVEPGDIPGVLRLIPRPALAAAAALAVVSLIAATRRRH